MQEITQIKKFAKTHSVPIMKDEGVDFICNYIVEHDVKTILEIGTGIGYSSIRFAKTKEDVFSWLSYTSVLFFFINLLVLFFSSIPTTNIIFER